MINKNASIIQEFYKVRDVWSEIDKNESWRLAIWRVEYADVEIVHNFMEVEQSPIGVFEDLFFKFNIRHQGDHKEYIQELYNEFVSWFIRPSESKYDLIEALDKSKLLKQQFIVKENNTATIEDLWSELIRFKETFVDHADVKNFCIYFPYDIYSISNMSSFFNKIILTVPKGIRLVTMDMAQNSKIEISTSAKDREIYQILHPSLDMLNAVKNDMYKGATSNSTVDIEGRFQKQIIDTMESTTQKDKSLTSKEIKKLLSISDEIGTLNASTSGYLIASQASYQVQNVKESELYITKALDLSKQAMDNNESFGYPIWKSCMLLKAALLHGKKEKKQAIEVYQELNQIALDRGDIYYLMESYRMIGHLEYELSNQNTALDYMLLSLASGAYLEPELRVQSTYIHAAHMAHYLCKKIKDKESVAILESQLQEWLGENWQEILAYSHAQTSELKMKKTLF
ncbi:hypothetical protein [Myroides odoratimimus]|uniref:hypothetical protein n=1 Tax=Myroides odoratimimus TaxID=76832 RepID=UPI0009155A3C|nr:hypothetical protein [Myroides odoratimimus]SHL55980.1 hypothetical protein SAMN05444275_10522 [Myroides odoratimimus subsp. xuanwuensis]